VKTLHESVWHMREMRSQRLWHGQRSNAGIQASTVADGLALRDAAGTCIRPAIPKLWQQQDQPARTSTQSLRCLVRGRTNVRRDCSVQLLQRASCRVWLTSVSMNGSPDVHEQYAFDLDHRAAPYMQASAFELQ